MPADRIAKNGPQPGSEPGGALRDYGRLKLLLAGVIRSVRQMAEDRKDKDKSNECRKLLTRLAEDRFNLVVVGQFNRGKTSLMNAILGVDGFPTSVLPLTSVITAVSYGDRERVLIHWDWWSYTSEVPLSELAQYVTQEGNPGNQRRVVRAEVQLPVELLRLGFYFIDTPGVGSAIAANTATTTAFLPEADAVIFLTSFESPLAEAELRFLDQVRRHVRKIFVVINKRDLVPPEQQEAVVRFVQERLQEVLGEMRPPVYSVSARDALNAKQTGDANKLGRSGLPQLEKDLIDFLQTDKTREFLGRIADRTANILWQQAVEFEVSRTLGADVEKIKSFEEQLTDRLDKVRQEREKTSDHLRAMLRLELPRHFEAELDRPVMEVKTALDHHVRQYLTAHQVSADSVESDLATTAHTVAHKILAAWLAQHQREFQQVVEGIARDELRRIEDAVAELRRLGADAAGVPPGESSVGGQFNEILREIPLVFRDIEADLWRFGLPWWIDLVLPIPLAGTLITRRCLKQLNGLVEAYRQEIVSLLKGAVDNWVERLDRKLIEAIDDTVERQRHMLEKRVKPEEMANLDELRRRLDTVVSALGRMESGEGAPLSSTTAELEHVPRSDARARCSICVEAEKALFDFMRRRQYELSTSDVQQIGHAEQGGFCGLHTWQYEAISSPQGVCSAYPPVLSLLGRRLRSLAQWASSATAMIDGVQQLLPRASTCRACQLIAAVERATAKGIVAALAANDGSESKQLPPLCLRHLYSVLLAKPTVEIARLMIEEQSRVLDRLGEDMQRYALKHDALRRELATELEHQAHQIGLSRLVGLRNIVAPWKVDST